MAPTMGRWLGLPLLATIWIMSLIGMALAASLIVHYSAWPGALGRWVKATLAFDVTTMAVSMIFLFGLLFKRDLFGNVPLNLLVWFPVWALGLAVSIGLDIANDDNPCSIQRCLPLGTPCRRPRCSTFRTAEAFSWITWGFLTLYFLALGFSALHHRRRAARDRDLGAGAGGQAGTAGAGAGHGAGDQPQMGQAQA